MPSKTEPEIKKNKKNRNRIKFEALNKIKNLYHPLAVIDGDNDRYEDRTRVERRDNMVENILDNMNYELKNNCG